MEHGYQDHHQRSREPAGIATYGAVFGSLAHQAGLTFPVTVAMSALVFSGTAQFAALPLLQAAVGPQQLFVTAFLLSLRHLAMGLSLAPQLRSLKPGHRLVLAHGMNDESYALTVSHAARHGFDARYMLGTGLATFIAWTASTAAGTLLGGVVTDPAGWDLDFAFPAVFIALLVPLADGRAGVAAAITGALMALAAGPLLAGGGHILAGALAAAVVGGIVDRGP
ncbi:MAG: AzlC family ABC transporter permease [Bacillota bacterium]|nr:AzlC family ABC transporter permease [Bacillota bacterium]